MSRQPFTQGLTMSHFHILASSTNLHGDQLIYATGASTHGGAGNDQLIATASNQSLYGDAGNDSLTAYDATDLLYGGPGHDTFNVYSLSQAVDYNPQHDSIVSIGDPLPGYLF